MNNNPMVLNKHNTLVKSRYNLTSIQNKLYQFILYNTQKEYTIDKSMVILKIPRKSFAQIIPRRECEKKKLYNNFEKMRLKPINVKRIVNGGLVWSNYSFFSSFHYHKETQEFEFRMEAELVEMLMEYVKHGYTPLDILKLSKMESYYTQRFYELLRLWSNSKTEITYTVDEIKEYMMLDKIASYSQYGLFKAKILRPSMEELNNSNILNVEYKENKENKKITSITFKVEDPNSRLLLENKKISKIEEGEANKDIEIIDLNAPVSDLFIPDEEIFTKGTLRSFKKDFKNIDFRNKYMERAFDDAIMVTFDRDDVDTIKATSYKFFKGTLDNKIIEYKIEEKEDIKHKREMEMFW